MQQFSGVNALGYYLPTLLMQSVGVSSDYARLLTAANATVYLGAAFLCLMLIDLVGRRKYVLLDRLRNPLLTGDPRRLMLYGSVAIGTTYLVAAVTIKEAQIHPDQKRTLGAVTTAMFFVYYFCYGTSFAKVCHHDPGLPPGLAQLLIITGPLGIQLGSEQSRVEGAWCCCRHGYELDGQLRGCPVHQGRCNQPGLGILPP